MNFAEYQPVKPSWLTRQLWKASGADPGILAQCPYGEHVKFACLGGIVASTGVLAGFAGSYAFYTVFASADQIGRTDWPAVGLACFFGLIWGLVIFNLDRYIVASTGKGDGTEAITRQELVNALPRMVLGLIIAVTISKPLEIKIFEREIEARLPAYQDSLANVSTKFVTASDTLLRNRREQADNERTRLHEVRTAQTRRIDSLSNLVMAEVSGERGGRAASCGDTCKELKDRLRIVATERAATDTQLTTVDRTLAAIDSEQTAKKAKYATAFRGYAGFKARMDLAHRIAGPMVTAFIMLLFIAVELTPIFFKLMLVKGPYDYFEENIKEFLLARQGIERKYEFAVEGAPASDAEHASTNGARHDAGDTPPTSPPVGAPPGGWPPHGPGDPLHVERLVHHRPVRTLQANIRALATQHELSAYALSAWATAERERIDRDPGRYVITDADPPRPSGVG